MSLNKITINVANGGGKLRLAHTIKANYYKMGVRNFLFTKDDGFDATGVIFEYLNKNARLEIMYQRGSRPSHAVWIDTYNKQLWMGIIHTIQAGVSSRNHYYVAVEL